jgi:iron complex outermembrane receptor protein
MNYLGMQQQSYDTADGVGGITANLGNASLRGIETAWNLREGGFGFNVNGSYEKSSLSSVQYVASYALPPASSNVGQCTGAGGTVLGAGQSKCFNYNPYLINLSGEPTPFSPTFSGTATVDYRIPLFGGTLDPKLQFSYTSKQYGSLFEIPYFLMDARHLLNAYLSYDKGQWNSEFYITNATDQLYINGNFGGTNIFYGNPMQLGVRVRKDF